MITLDISPIAFTIGTLRIGWYSIMVVLAAIVLILWALIYARKEAVISYETVLNAALVGIPSGLIFSRLLHVVDHWSYYSQNPGQIIGGSGLTIYGAILGTALGIWVYYKLRKQSIGYLADMLAPGAALAQIIGRIGCIINGCCHGIETYAFCAVVYTHPDSLAPIGVPVHFTQMYEIIYLLIIFTALFKLRKRIQPEGSLFLIYLSLYSLWRVGIDFLREGTPLLIDLHEAQIIGIIVLVIAVPWLIMRARWVSGKA